MRRPPSRSKLGAVKILAGTSGFSYPAWKGSFYPADLPAAKMLGFYSTRLPAVEINNTFYRLPKPELLEGWREEVPASFRFALKASQKITHIKRLKDAGEETRYLLRVAALLGRKLGPILFQLPPNLKLDLPRLQAFLVELPEDTRAAFEFRHPSWRSEEVYAALREHGAAWCVADVDPDTEEPATEDAEIVATADWGYLRLRRSAYDDAALARWAERVRAAGWREAYTFFKHEDAGVGPRLAAAFLERCRAAS